MGSGFQTVEFEGFADLEAKLLELPNNIARGTQLCERCAARAI